MDRKLAANQGSTLGFGTNQPSRGNGGSRSRASRLEGKVCPRCGRILTTAERLLAEMQPPAVCTDCTHKELVELEARIRMATPASRRIRWNKMIGRAATKASERLAAAL